MAVVDVVVAKQNQTKDTRAKYTISHVTAGPEIRKRLEKLGPNELIRLKIDELYALLVNVDPHGSLFLSQ